MKCGRVQDAQDVWICVCCAGSRTREEGTSSSRVTRWGMTLQGHENTYVVQVRRGAGAA